MLALAISQENDLISGSFDKTIKIWNMCSGKLKKTLTGHDGSVNALVISKNGDLCSGSDDHFIYVWDTPSGQSVGYLNGHKDSVTALTVTRDNLLVSASRDRFIKIWHLENLVCLKTLQEAYSDGYVLSLAISAQEKLVSAGITVMIKV